jgi:outer membrane receptor protein involved in Fe transport
MRFKNLAVTFLTLVVLAGAAIAQTSKGILAGVVRDATGAAIAEASVTVINQDTNETRIIKSGGTGSYRADAISPGTYTIRVELAGFDRFEAKNIAVLASVVTSFDPTLQVGSISQTVEVQANSAQLNTENGSLSGTISTVEMTKLPIFSLNPIELATTLPGVQMVSNSAFSNGQSIQVSGARPRANNFLINGQEINDLTIGGQAVQPEIPSMYQDTVVYTHNPPAEYGRASGGVVNLIGRTGTNQFHGQAWELYSGSGLNAIQGPNRGTDAPKTRFNQHQFGFTVGGPIWKNKLFAFGGAQWSRLYGKETPPFITYPDANGIALLKQIAGGSGITATNAQLLLTYLDNGAYLNTYTSGNTPATGNSLGAACPTSNPNCQLTTNSFARPAPAQENPDTQWTYRIDFSPRAKDTFFGFYLHDRSSLTPDLFANPFAQPGFDTFQGGPSELGQIGWTHIFTANLLNEFRVAETRINFLFAPTPETLANPLYSAPTLSFNNATDPSQITDVGFNAASFPQGRIQETYQFQDTVSWTHGRHTIRVGGDIGRQLADILVPQNNQGTLTFAGGGTGITQTGNFLLNQLGPSGTAVRSFGPTRFDPHLWRIGTFFQDDFKFTPDLVLNLGVRYDYVTPISNSLPFPAIDPSNLYGPIATVVPQKADKNNIAPRVGFSYAPRGNRILGDGKTVIRGAFGVFFDSDFTNIASNSASTAPNSVSGTLTQPGGNGLPNATGQLALITPQLTQQSSVESVDKNLVAPYTYNYNLGVERSLPGSLLFTATYVGSRGVKLFANQQYNYFDSATGERLDPSRGPIIARGNYAVSSYNGVDVTLEHNFNHGFLIRGTYTYSKSLDNGSEVFAPEGEQTSYAADLAPGGRRFDWGNSAYDHRNWFALTYVWSPTGFRGNGTFSNAMLGVFTRGWTVSGTSQFQSGAYSTVNVGGLDLNGDGSAFNDRPILGNPHQAFNTVGIDGTWVTDANGNPGTPGTYYDQAANNQTGALNVVTPDQVHWLIYSGPQFLHQSIGRNSFKNPYQQFHNIALEKGFSTAFAHFDRGSLVLRAELQDLANHNNIGPLNVNLLTVGTPSFQNLIDGRVGNLSGTPDGRVMRLWAKFVF